MLEQAGTARSRAGEAPAPGRLPPRVAPVTRAAFQSVAVELPPARLTSAELGERLGLREEWILSRTGVRERPVAGPEERLSDYSARAGLRALELAELDPGEVDLVIAATMTQDELTPSTAPLVAHAIGAHRAGGFDVGAACNAFLTGISLAAAQIETGRARHVLLIGSDFITRITNWSDARSAPLFGDAAGAAVLGPAGDGPGAIGPVVLGMDGSNPDAIRITHEERR